MIMYENENMNAILFETATLSIYCTARQTIFFEFKIQTFNFKNSHNWLLYRKGKGCIFAFHRNDRQPLINIDLQTKNKNKRH